MHAHVAKCLFTFLAWRRVLHTNTFTLATLSWTQANVNIDADADADAKCQCQNQCNVDCIMGMHNESNVSGCLVVWLSGCLVAPSFKFIN